ncbi:hypothetical protein CDL12_28589 [Handroanthus impetiginosus]|uniref:BED-type domain-containing protein n=1 Tax=Handroanthus impetiginosus TaxID=429701 RepID=A0A2G9G0U3_9LAMI|nr:hypothetical protein CDL12_28589 [Handroanthus impetiginosus]
MDADLKKNDVDFEENEDEHATEVNENEIESDHNPYKRKYDSRLPHWAHFKKVNFIDKKGVQQVMSVCNYCRAEIMATPKKHLTNGFRNHHMSCKKKPHEVEIEQRWLHI